jgi:hemerythrin-like metal-binding protein
MAIVWRDDYSVGLVTIDEQHKVFISILGRLSAALSERKLQEETVGILKELEQYAEAHLAFEERHFQEYGYEWGKSHTEEHDSYREKLKDLRNRYMRGDEFLAMEMLGFLEGWLEHHIKVSDREYVDCFRSHGMK